MSPVIKGNASGESMLCLQFIGLSRGNAEFGFLGFVQGFCDPVFRVDGLGFSDWFGVVGLTFGKAHTVVTMEVTSGKLGEVVRFR